MFDYRDLNTRLSEYEARREESMMRREKSFNGKILGFVLVFIVMGILSWLYSLDVFADGRLRPVGPKCGQVQQQEDYRIKRIGDFPMGWNYDSQSGRWWFKTTEENGSIIHDDNLHWIMPQGKSIGILYAFSHDGWMLADQWRDGYYFDHNGAMRYDDCYVVTHNPYGANKKMEIYLLDSLEGDYLKRLQGPYKIEDLRK